MLELTHFASVCLGSLSVCLVTCPQTFSLPLILDLYKVQCSKLFGRLNYTFGQPLPEVINADHFVTLTLTLRPRLTSLKHDLACELWYGDAFGVRDVPVYALLSGLANVVVPAFAHNFQHRSMGSAHSFELSVVNLDLYDPDSF